MVYIYARSHAAVQGGVVEVLVQLMESPALAQKCFEQDQVAAVCAAAHTRDIPTASATTSRDAARVAGPAVQQPRPTAAATGRCDGAGPRNRACTAVDRGVLSASQDADAGAIELRRTSLVEVTHA